MRSTTLTHPRRAGRGLVAAGAVLAGLAVVWSTTGTTAAQAEQRISVYEAASGFAADLDLGAAGPSAGDKIFEHKPVYGAESDERVGATVTEITIVQPDGDHTLMFVDCELGLAGGAVLLAGGGRMSDLHGDGITLAVTGGKGEYRGATGDVRIRAGQRRGQTVHTFDLTLES